MFFNCTPMVFNISEWHTVAIFDCELFDCFYKLNLQMLIIFLGKVSKGPEAALDPQITCLKALSSEMDPAEIRLIR
jgi:hypothetical protein